MKRVGDLTRLLKPHALPHLGTLVLVVVCGLASAFLQKGTYLLLMPTWEALFPEVRTEAPVEPEQDPDGIVDRVEEWLEEVGGSAERFILGDPEVLASRTPEARSARRSALLRVGAIVGAMALLAAVFQYLTGLLAGKVSLRIMVSLRVALAEHLMTLSMRYHTGRRFGDLLSRVSSDVGRTTQVVRMALKDLVQEPLLFVASLLFAFAISWKVTLFVVLGLPLFIAPIAILVNKVRRTSHKSAVELGSTFQVLTQMFQGVRTVKAYRAEERELDRFRAANEDYYGATMRMVRAGVLSRAWTIFFTNFGIAIVVVVAGWLLTGPAAANGDQPEAKEMLALFLMISQASSHIKRTTRVITQVGEAEGAARRLHDVLEVEPEVVEAAQPVALAGLGDGVRFEHVGFEYQRDEDDAADVEPFRLSGIDLTVRPGETLALVGASGSGKSTLLDLVARFVDPTSGRVLVGGHDLKDVSFDSWTDHYALVTQSPFLFHTTVAENIRYGRPDASQADVEAAARAANIHEFIESLPAGYGTNVQDAGTRLSGGQRQRITIARALLRDPELLLLDEATSALDTESEKIVQEALDRVMKGRTTIVIAHRLTTIRNADRICVMDAGRVVEVGTHDELLEQNGAYARLQAAQTS
ncbi:MAG: ABC transporter ATP-binding protein [Planctomycetota bacterium]